MITGLFSLLTCALEILRGVFRNRPVIVVTRHGKVLANLNKYAPAAMRWFARRL